MPILNYTTSIDAFKTIGEIQQKLAAAGAKKVAMDYDSEGNAISLTFCIEWNDRLVAFNLPCNFEGVLKSMTKNSKVPRNKCTKEQALRVGWRIIKDWTEAQLAIVESELAGLPEVFLPYAVTKDGSTVFKYLESTGQKLLT